MNTRLLRGTTVVTMLASLLFAGSVMAGKPQLDAGTQLNATDPYKEAQVVEGLHESKSIYGALNELSAADIYKFRVNEDSEKTVSLLVRNKQEAQPLLILMDPTDKTEVEELGLPIPGEDYHATVIDTVTDGRPFYEAALFQRFTVVAEQKLELAKDTDYYLIVIDPYGSSADYAIKFGEGQSWTAKDVVVNFGSWVRLQTGIYAGNNPFAIPEGTVGMSVLFLGLIVLIGTFVIEQAFAFLSLRYMTAAYLYVKVQVISRVAIWLALWFTAVGMYLHFDRSGWVGIPFVLVLLFLGLVISQLLYTLRFSRQVSQVEVTEEAASLPLPLRKKQVAFFVVNLILQIAIVVLLVMSISN